MSPADRKADRHPRPVVSARLDADDDRWLREHVRHAGTSIRQVVIAAVRAYRKQVETKEQQHVQQD